MGSRLGGETIMKIAIFGCSWTHGVGTVENYLNWPELFAQRLPEHDIRNYALAGTSINFHIYLLRWVKQHDPADLYIFQLTRPERFTYWKDKQNWNDYLIEERLANYRSFGDNIKVIVEQDENKNVLYHRVGRLVIQLINQSSNLTTTPDMINLAKSYYSHVNDEAFQNEWDIASEYVMQHTDWCYQQTEGEYRKRTHIPCWEDILGEKQCKEYWAQGSHMGREGLQVTADWVYENVKDKLLAKM